MTAVLGSLLIGLIAGFLGQRSRMCFIGGFRDFIIIRDKELLRGVIAFFASAWFTICSRASEELGKFGKSKQVTSAISLILFLPWRAGFC